MNKFQNTDPELAAILNRRKIVGLNGNIIAPIKDAFLQSYFDSDMGWSFGFRFDMVADEPVSVYLPVVSINH